MRERKNLIGVKQTLIWLERAVAERGADFNYRKHFGRDAATCKYREGNKPGCIVGMVFSYARIPVNHVVEYEDASACQAAIGNNARSVRA